MSDFKAYRFAVAPMIDWTDSRCRQFHRLMTRHALLYTEMVTAPAILFGDRDRLLGFEPTEHPVALQLGGSDPKQMAEAARIGADYGYDEINMNVGCPSDRVQSGKFGACLMAEPGLVADCVAAMKAAVTLPVTVKCRIGIDDQDPEEALPRLTQAVIAAGTDHLIVHARKAWLQGLSPKENRTIPPLDYGIVRRLKAAHPELPMSINGGIADLDAAERLLLPEDGLPGLDGVMLGRAAYETPRILTQVDRRIFGDTRPDADPFEIAERIAEIARPVLARGGKLSNVVRHTLGLFNGMPGAKLWRRILTVEAIRPDAGLEVLDEALAAVRKAVADAEIRAEQRAALSA